MPDAVAPSTASLRRLLLLVLLAIPACAAPPPAGPLVAAPPVISGEPGGKPPPAVRHAADIPGPACAPEHRAMFEEAMPVARDRTAEALRFLRQQPEHEHVRRWFGTAPPAEVAQRLERVAAWLADPEEVKLLCNDPPNCGGARMAFTAPARRIMGLCPGFFRAAMEGFDSRWGTIVHEISHIAAGTSDHAYGRNAALVLAKSDPARAAANADNLEYFVETLPR